MISTVFQREFIQLLYMETDSFVLGVNTNDIVKDLQNLKNLVNFINLQENHEPISF